jgi:hypothetical protein
LKIRDAVAGGYDRTGGREVEVEISRMGRGGEGGELFFGKELQRSDRSAILSTAGRMVEPEFRTKK